MSVSPKDTWFTRHHSRQGSLDFCGNWNSMGLEIYRFHNNNDVTSTLNLRHFEVSRSQPSHSMLLLTYAWGYFGTHNNCAEIRCNANNNTSTYSCLAGQQSSIVTNEEGTRRMQFILHTAKTMRVAFCVELNAMLLLLNAAGGRRAWGVDNGISMKRNRNRTYGLTWHFLHWIKGSVE